MTESAFIKWLLDNRDFVGRSLTSKSISALSDFYFGHVVLQYLDEPLLIGFQTWLGVELRFLQPSKVRGGLWIGDSISWSTMLRRYCDTESSAFERFFDMIEVYDNADRHEGEVFALDGIRKGTSLVKDYGNGLPQALNAYSIAGHDGVYVRSLYGDGVTRLIGYFSNISEVASQVERTKASTADQF